MNRVLVTGATGFTGKALCERLIKDGEDVTAFVRASSDTSRLQEIGVHCVQADITQAADVDKHFADFDRSVICFL